MFEKYNIDPKTIGRLEVGTETIIDKSKATKTVLMDLFKESGNFDVEGIDTKNACYGGTAALLNSIAWIESSAWDGRLAVVVAGDIAVYAKGPARPTGGCGAVAMLIGPNAPIVIERGLRGSHMENFYDFYKPDPTVEYPTVVGSLSNMCYLKALDGCYKAYSKKYENLYGERFDIDKADFICFHSPYNKLVQKSTGRLLYNDFLNNPGRPDFKDAQELAKISVEESYTNRDIERVFVKKSAAAYKTKVSDATKLPKLLGNLYTASLYSGLISLLCNKKDSELLNKRILCFSYGSGFASTMFSLRVVGSVENIVKNIGLERKLAQRRHVTPEEYHKTMDLRESRVLQKDYTPTDPINNLYPGTWYLVKVDKKGKREYSRTPVVQSKL